MHQLWSFYISRLVNFLAVEYTVRQKYASETEGEGLRNSDQGSDAICGRNVGYNEETRKTR